MQIKNVRLKLALIAPTVASMTVANDVIEILSVVRDKTINDLSKLSNKAIYLLTKSFTR